MNTIRLKKSFQKGDFEIGASIPKQISWYLANLLIFRSGIIPFSCVLVFFLRCFGARIGKNVRIKPHFYVKYPWKLSIGDRSWLADCYIENLAPVDIGEDVCVSQQCKIITGNHDFSSPDFLLFTKSVKIQNGAWLAAGAIVGPGVNVGTHAVLTLGSVASKHLEPYTIYKGHPAISYKKRHVNI